MASIEGQHGTSAGHCVLISQHGGYATQPFERRPHPRCDLHRPPSSPEIRGKRFRCERANLRGNIADCTGFEPMGAPNEPSPPKFETAAVSLCEEKPPSGPWMTGYSMTRISATRVCFIRKAARFALHLPDFVPSSGRLYLLTGPQTVSASITTAAFVKQAAGSRAIILGEPVGDRLTFFMVRAMKDVFPLPALRNRNA